MRTLPERPYLRALLANAGWLMADRLLRLVLGVFIGAWVARYLGPESYGELAYGVAFLAVFQALSALSLEGVLVREVSQRPQRSGMLVGTAFCLRLAVSVLAWAAACLAVRLMRPEDTRALLIVGILGLGMLFQSTDVIETWLQSQMRSRLSVSAKAFAYCTTSVIKILLVLNEAPLWTFALALTLDAALAAGALLIAYRRHRALSRWSWDGETARLMLRETAPFLLASLAMAAFARVDQIMLRELAGDHALGVYSAALPFSLVWQMLAVAAYVSLLPRLSSLRIQDEAMYARRLQQCFILFLWCGVLVAATMALLADVLLTHLLGAAYAESVDVLRVHALSNIFYFLGIARNLATVAERRSAIALWSALAGLFVNLMALLLLVPRFGGQGAAWAAVISSACSAYLVQRILDPRVFRMQSRAFNVARLFRPAADGR
ncbi:MAG: flippase [Candidatus Dactylopiibacterium sp.]|nr:flippase [Candidatus Dactylopiibacterium sp.]